MLQNDPRSFLGTGWKIPPTFDLQSGAVELVSNEADIKESLDILLSTSLGERVMQPRYGCDLQDYIFEPLNAAMIGFLRDLVENAILFYEPRIKVEEITVVPMDSPDLIEGRFTIAVDYTIASTNSRYNYVYDFYLLEAAQKP
jgi:phage baseplate assembly protein W